MAYTAESNSSKGYSKNRTTASEDFTYKGSGLVRNPNFAPFTQWRDSLWVNMVPLKLENQNSAGRGGVLSIGGENRPTFSFLAPASMQENIAHTWDSFDSIQSRLMGKLVGAAKLGAEVNAMKNSISNMVEGSGSETKIKAPQGLHAAAIELAKNISGTDVPKFKVDTPLRYMDSTRREIVMEFHLMASGPVMDEWAVPQSEIKHSVTDIVRDLMMYSSPAIKNTSSIEYEFPYIWRLETYPKSFLLYEFCALTNVQPTWNAPYIDGYPTHCALTLTFKDLSPLFRSTIKHGSSINVIDASPVGLSESQQAALFDDVKVPILKRDTIKALLDARTKFKRAQAIQKSLTSGNERSVLKYFQGRGTDQFRKYLDSDKQRKINEIPVGKNTPNIIQKIPRI